MQAITRALLQAFASLLHPRMLWLTVAPLLVASVVWGLLLYFSWQPVLQYITDLLAASTWVNWLYRAGEAIGLTQLNKFLAPLLMLALLIPAVVVSALWYVALFSMPTITRFLGQRHYASLEQKHGGNWLGGLFYSAWTTLLFAVMAIVLLPLWLIPPFFIVVPPLLWGWLTYRVMSYDALAEHATAEERKLLLKQHRWQLLLMGVGAGLMGSAPTVLWVSSVAMLVLFPFVAIGALWLYVLIFVLSGLWFSHYCLQALTQLRQQQSTTMIDLNAPPGVQAKS